MSGNTAPAGASSRTSIACSTGARPCVARCRIRARMRCRPSPATTAASAMPAATSQGSSVSSRANMTGAVLFVPLRLGAVDLRAGPRFRVDEIQRVLAHLALFRDRRELAVLVQDGDELPVDFRVALDAFLLLEEVGLAREVADEAARFGDEQRPRCDVPRRQPGLEEAFGETCGHMREVQRGR